MEIKVYKTLEIIDSWWNQIVNGFNSCFENSPMTKNELLTLYVSNSYGYCYHSLVFDKSKIIAFNTYTPHKYKYGNEFILLVLSGSTYVLKEYRKDIFILKDMRDALVERCRKDGFIASIGVPNQNSYKYVKVFCGALDIMSLSYWVLPVKLGTVINRTRILNVFSIFFAKIIMHMNLLFSSLFDFSAEDSMIHIVKDDDFISKRLSSGKYVNIQKEDRFFSYTVDSYKNVRCAYIMCAYKNYRNNYKCLVDGIKYILSNEKIDIIMFNGTLNLKQFLLFKVPKCLEPKILPLTIGFMDKRYKEEYSGLLEGKNWDYSLINLDVR